jgi:hypothetical protein
MNEKRENATIEKRQQNVEDEGFTCNEADSIKKFARLCFPIDRRCFVN